MNKTETIYRLDYMLDVLDELRDELDFINDNETIDYVLEAIDNIENIKCNVIDIDEWED